jgi:hypothetical protein
MMKFLRFLLPLAVASCGVEFSLLAQESYESGYASEKEATERDMQALQEYIKTKRAITVREKGGNLMISGDVRGEWYYMKVKTNHDELRGWNSRKLYPNSFLNKKTPRISHKAYKALPFAERVAYRQGRDAILPPYTSSEFDAEANLVFDYIAERGWATIRLQFSNPAGLTNPERKAIIYDNRRIMYGSGRVNDLALRKCYGGYNVWEQGTSRFDLEIGRRRLYDAFDSRIEFWSYFDGILARFTSSYEGITDLSFKIAAFVVDHSVNHYGYVGELGLMNLVDTGLDLKYSLIDWDTLHRKNRFGRHHPLGTRFINSQILANYTLSPDIVSIKTTVYAAYLFNHVAKANGWTNHRKARDAYYVGGRIGEALRKGDYSMELFYQWVKAQSVPEADVSVASRENPRGVSFYNRRSGGRANFRGWRLEGFYALTDNWTLNAHFDRIREMDRHIGGKHRSWEFYFGAIFTF